MVNRYFYLILLIVASFADVRLMPAQTPEKTPVKAAVNKYPNLKMQAQAVGDATLNKDFDKIVDFTHPKVVAAAGGRIKMIAGLKRMDDQMVAETGVKLTGVRFGDVEQESRVGNEIFVVLPMTLVMQIGTVKLEGDSSIVGISSDTGTTWKFINGVNQVRFAQMFPDVGNRIKVREDGPPRRVD